jgi:4-hydroxybenzoate polyprenyltransferase
VILGDPGHAEVEALMGEARGRAVVIQKPGDAEALPETDRVVLLAQTTQNREAFEAVAKAVSKRYQELGKDNLCIENTICDSTRRRQDEVRKMAGEPQGTHGSRRPAGVEAMVVVGGKASANTRRLTEICQEQAVPAFLVESEKDLEWDELKKFRTIGLTAGASTPNWVIRRVYEELQRSVREDMVWPLRWLYLAVRSLVVSNVYISLGAVSLCLASGFLQGFLPRYQNLMISFLYIFAMHTFNILFNREAVWLIEPVRSNAFETHRRLWISFSLLTLALAFGLSISIGLWSFLLLFIAAVPGLLYQVRILSRRRSDIFPYRSLAEIPGSKDIFSALGWALVCVILPLLDDTASSQGFLKDVFYHSPSSATAAAFIFVFVLVFMRSVIQDFRDIQGDRMVGRETIPIALGERRTRRLLTAAVLALGLALLVLYFLEHLPYLALWLLVPVAYAGLTVSWFTRRTIVQGIRAESLVDLTFIIAGLLAFLDKFIRMSAP